GAAPRGRGADPARAARLSGGDRRDSSLPGLGGGGVHHRGDARREWWDTEAMSVASGGGEVLSPAAVGAALALVRGGYGDGLLRRSGREARHQRRRHADPAGRDAHAASRARGDGGGGWRLR